MTVALLVGVLTLYSMTKIWAEAFWKDAPEADSKVPKSEAEPSSGCLNFSLVAPCVALAVMTLVIGFWSTPLFDLAKRSSQQLLDPDAYIAAVLERTHHESMVTLDD